MGSTVRLLCDRDAAVLVRSEENLWFPVGLEVLSADGRAREGLLEGATEVV